MFHLSRKRTDPAVTETRVRVQDGYHPDTIHATAGQPVRIIFRREETSPCSERVVFGALGESLALPRGKDVTFEWLPEMTGELEFTCGMGMLRGRVIVDPPVRAAQPAA